MGGEDENCTDVVCVLDTVASLADGFYNSLTGNEYSADIGNSGIGKTIRTFSTKEDVRVLGIMSTIFHESKPNHRVALRVIPQSQRELRKKRIQEYYQTNTQSYFTNKRIPSYK